MTKKDFNDILMKSYVDIYNKVVNELYNVGQFTDIDNAKKSEIELCYFEICKLIKAQMKYYQGYAYGEVSDFVKNYNANNVQQIDPYNNGIKR